MMGGGGHPAVGSAPAETTSGADASTAAAVPVAPVPRPVSTATIADTLRQARTARNSGDTARAHDLYQQAVALSPDDADALVGLGDLARAQGKITDARAYFEHALIGTPSNVPALLGLADSLWDLDSKDQARARYAEVLRRAPTGTYPERVKDRAQ
jgi:tetratricopeptide (TPR) repeat protein